jgi:hypothetical protein
MADVIFGHPPPLLSWPGLVPAISIRKALLCLPKRDARDIRAFTPVFAGYARA